MICPRASICSEGVAQVILIALARISAFALYVCMAWTFASKMHSWHHFLSSTYAENIFPFESMHKVHHRQGTYFAALALLHTIVHIIRWGLRKELGTIGLESAGVSGYFAMFFMVVVIWSMTLAKKVKWMKFEHRFNLHWLFSGVVFALCFHTKRTTIITLFFAGSWFADYIYGYLFRTHRLDIAEFTTLADGKGTQMLWRNPSGFHPKSGEFVRIQIPWLTEGGSEWHPFSLYMEEATEEGIQEMRKKSSVLGEDAKGGQRVSPSKSVLILLECQNEWASSTTTTQERGKGRPRVTFIGETLDSSGNRDAGIIEENGDSSSDDYSDDDNEDSKQQQQQQQQQQQEKIYKFRTMRNTGGVLYDDVRGVVSNKVLENLTSLTKIRAIEEVKGKEETLIEEQIQAMPLHTEFKHVEQKKIEQEELVQSNKVLENLTSLTKMACKMGAQVFHAPIIFKADMSNNYNSQLGILKDYRLKGMFLESSWNADFVAGLKPEQGDCTVTNKVGLDAFFRTNLEELIVEKGIETVILGGFLTNGSVESITRSAHEKGLNVIILTDGTVCRSALKQKIATESSFEYFSTPMTCSQVELIFQGQAPSALSMITKPLSSRAMDISDELEESLEDFLAETLDRPLVEEDLLTLKEAREDVNNAYKTTQVFIQAAGDWSNGLNRDLKEGKQKRACWVRGPYISPYFVAKEFSHLLLTATGIGITPALGVLGQYPGNARTKILVWFVRSEDMLKFFAPLLKSAHLVLIYYTGKEKLTSGELKGLRDHGNGNIYIQQSRPNIVAVLTSVIVHLENQVGFFGELDAMSSLQQIDLSARKAWCVLYCGGSIKIKDMIKQFTKDAGVGWQCELFDW